MYMKFVVGMVVLLCLSLATAMVTSILSWSQSEVARAKPGAAVEREAERLLGTKPERSSPPLPRSQAEPPAPPIRTLPEPTEVVSRRPEPVTPVNAPPPIPVNPATFIQRRGQERPVVDEFPTEPQEWIVELVPPTAGQPPTTSQPTSALYKYYSLLKNEFIKTEDGRVTFVPDELRQAIAALREKAAREKRRLDQQIADITASIAASEQARKTAVSRERELKTEASKNARRSKTTHWVASPRGISVHTHRDRLKESLATKAKAAAREQQEAARRRQSDARALMAQRAQLQKEAAAWGAVAVANDRVLPPRTFWNELPPAQQEQIARVGLTLDEFKRLITTLGETEESFLEAAKAMEAPGQSADQLADRLLDYFEGHKPPRPQM